MRVSTRGHSSSRKFGARPDRDEHAAPTALLDEPLVDELLVTLENRQRVQRVIRGNAAHRRQRVTIGKDAFQDHRDDFVA
jgi:hypothetical protein